MKRVDLLQQCEIIAPALASREFVPSMTCFWFDGSGRVMAFNENMAISSKSDLEFKGGIRGKQLMQLLGLSHAKTVEMEMEEDDKPRRDGSIGRIKLKSGKTRMKFSVMDWDEFAPLYSLFNDPNYKKAQKVPSEYLHVPLRRSLLAEGTHTAIPDQKGATLIADQEHLHCFSTNNEGIAWTKMPRPDGYDIERVMVPHDFTKQFLKIDENYGTGKRLLFSDQWLRADFEDDTFLYSRILEPSQNYDWSSIIKKHNLDDGKFHKRFIPLPKNFELAIRRAATIFEGAPGAQPTEFKISGNKMTLHTANSSGEVRDTLTLEDEHPAITGRFKPSELANVLDVVTVFYVNEKKSFISSDTAKPIDGQQFVYILASQ